MTLVDAGPLVALIDADEPDHASCVLALSTLTSPLITTWPAFTEAMYLVSRAGAATGRRALFKLVTSQHLTIVDLPPESLQRTAALMEKYGDLPMDLADATLVALAEHRGERRIFTLDSDFTIYRLHGRTRFQTIPR